MKYFFDTEFLEDGKTIELISIGIVAEDGREYYAINEEAPWGRVVNDKWLRENVAPSLPLIVTALGDGHRYDIQDGPAWRLKTDIRNEVVTFVGASPEFWAYYADYDWVCFCQLFGRMIDLPHGFPMYCRDIKQLCDSLGNPKLPEQLVGEHNALADAKWNAVAHEFLVDYQLPTPLTPGVD